MSEWENVEVEVIDYVTDSAAHWWDVYPYIGRTGIALKKTKAGMVLVRFGKKDEFTIPPSCPRKK